MRQALKIYNRLEELTLTITLLGLASVAFIQVCTRYTMGISFDWFEEGGRYLGVFITFLGASVGVKRGIHFSMEIVVNALPLKHASRLRAIIAFFSSYCFFMVAWYGHKIVLRNYKYGITSASIEAPMWLVYLPIPVFSVLIAMRFFGVGVGKLFEKQIEEKV